MLMGAKSRAGAETSSRPGVEVGAGSRSGVSCLGIGFRQRTKSMIETRDKFSCLLNGLVESLIELLEL